MKIKFLKEECFQDYKKPSMLIGTCYCDWKCFGYCSENICQNKELADSEIIEISDYDLISKYLDNPITSAIVFGGLDPMMQFFEVLHFIHMFRELGHEDDIVIYTGYYPDEIGKYLEHLKLYKNIYLKCGRFKPNSEKKYDEVLGITLASDNQFGLKLS